MIVPARALLVLAALWLLPAALLCGMPGRLAWWGAAALALLAAAMVLDALLSIGLLSTVDVAAPSVVRAVVRRPALVHIALRSAHERRWLRVGLESEPSLVLEQPLQQARLQAELTLEFRFDPRERGRAKLHACWLETRSRLGLWLVRERRALTSTVRVYPDLHRERKSVAAVFAYRHLPGQERFLPLGKGREFDRVREYVAGDPIEHMHWKATAKRGRPITKLFQVERAQHVIVAVDDSRVGLRRARSQSGADSETVHERFVQSALTLCGAAQRFGDAYGLIEFDSEVQRYVRPGSGSAQLNACREALFEAKPSETTADYAALFAFLKSRLPRRALVFVLTQAEDPFVADELAAGAALVSGQHLLVVVTPGSKAVAPVLSSPVSSREQAYEHLAGHFVWRRRAELSRTLERVRARLLAPELAKLSASVINHYLTVKRRQLL